MHSARNLTQLSGVVTIGYSWLTTARCDYFCCQHAGVSMGREAVGGGKNNPFQDFNSFVRVVLP